MIVEEWTVAPNKGQASLSCGFPNAVVTTKWMSAVSAPVNYGLEMAASLEKEMLRPLAEHLH